MALVIHIKKDQQIILNGAVVENASGKTISLVLKNEAAVLRSEDILAPDDAVTPAGRVYYALQCVYLFPERRGAHLRTFNDLAGSFLRAAPSARSIVAAILAAVENEQYYAALKKAQELIKHEGKVLSHAQHQLDKELHVDAATGESEGDRGVGADAGCIALERRGGGQ